jgi:hypothetical protein
LDKGRLRGNAVWIEIEIIHELIVSTPFPHADDKSERIIEVQLSEPLADKIMLRIVTVEPEVLAFLFFLFHFLIFS